jgi:hypothetical protein
MSSQPWRVKLRITTNGTGMLPSSVIPFLRSLWKNLSNSVSEIPFWCGGISAAVSLIPYLVNRNVSQVFLGKLCKRIRACYSPQPTVEFTSARLLRIPIIHFLPVGRNRPDVGYDVTMPHASLCETMHHAHSNHPSHSCIHTHTPGGTRRAVADLTIMVMLQPLLFPTLPWMSVLPRSSPRCTPRSASPPSRHGRT